MALSRITVWQCRACTVRHFQLPISTIRGDGIGRLIPTTSIDKYAATLAHRCGLSNSDIVLLFPNLSNRMTTPEQRSTLGDSNTTRVGLTRPCWKRHLRNLPVGQRFQSHNLNTNPPETNHAIGPRNQSSSAVPFVLLPCVPKIEAVDHPTQRTGNLRLGESFDRVDDALSGQLKAFLY